MILTRYPDSTDFLKFQSGPLLQYDRTQEFLMHADRLTSTGISSELAEVGFYGRESTTGDRALRDLRLTKFSNQRLQLDDNYKYPAAQVPVTATARQSVSVTRLKPVTQQQQQQRARQGKGKARQPRVLPPCVCLRGNDPPMPSALYGCPASISRVFTLSHVINANSSSTGCREETGNRENVTKPVFPPAAPHTEYRRQKITDCEYEHVVFIRPLR